MHMYHRAWTYGPAHHDNWASISVLVESARSDWDQVINQPHLIEKLISLFPPSNFFLQNICIFGFYESMYLIHVKHVQYALLRYYTLLNCIIDKI